MSLSTTIQWCDATLNPWWGCTKVSAGCKNCYAEALDKRWHSGANWQPFQRMRIASFEDNAMRLDRHAEASGERIKVFPSMMDWLDPQVRIEWFGDFLSVMGRAKHLDWLLLTKRPELFLSRIKEVHDSGFSGVGAPCWNLIEDWLDGKPRANIWQGASVENQESADERIPALCKIPARVRFLSCEPLLGWLELDGPFDRPQAFPLGRAINWVIVGGESGPHSRRCEINWIRRIVRVCKSAEVPVFVKQLGSHATQTINDKDNVKTETLPLNDMKDSKGGDPEEWPEELRIRQWPEVTMQGP